MWPWSSIEKPIVEQLWDKHKEQFALIVASIVTSALILYTLWLVLRTLYWLGEQFQHFLVGLGKLLCCGSSLVLDAIGKVFRLLTGLAVIALIGVGIWVYTKAPTLPFSDILHLVLKYRSYVLWGQI